MNEVIGVLLATFFVCVLWGGLVWLEDVRGDIDG